jgi:hypothetical protein
MFLLQRALANMLWQRGCAIGGSAVPSAVVRTGRLMTMPRSVQVLTVAVGAALLAFAAAATAPFHSPWLVERFQCPEGTTLRVQEYHASWHTPGETGISIVCVDALGTVLTSENETRGFWLLVGMYFPLSFAALMIVAALFVVLRRRLTIR